jgi:PncC family amidohydrolase
MDALISNMHLSIDKQAQNVVKLLYTRKLRLCTAESCTGGLLSGAITGVEGASEVFNLGICAYANDVKQDMLGVSAETLEKYGAVSEQCAVEMAQGASKLPSTGGVGADVGVSVTGIAGPGGGSAQKPVGTVFVACSYKEKTNTLHLKLDGERQKIRLESVKRALELIVSSIN